MKNHSENQIEAKNFILYYEIKDNQLIVHYASGKIDSVPYDKYTEINLLKEMESQLTNNNEEEKTRQLEKKYKYNIIARSFYFIFNLFCIAFGTAFIAVNGSLFAIILGGTIVVFYTIGAVQNIKEFIKNTIKLKDLKKHITFLKNKDNIARIDKKNEQVLLQTSKKTKEIVSSTPVDQPLLTINSIHLMKYKELKKIIENVEIINQLDFIYSNGSQKSKAKDSM